MKTVFSYKEQMNRFEEFETFVRVVEAGSITAAAEQLGIAKSAVSRRLKELEARLGVQLMTRSTRQIVFTETGRVLYERALSHLADWKETESLLSDASSKLSGLIKIAAPVSFGVAHLGPAILDFSKRHPDVEFDIDLNDQVVDLIADGRDLAIRIGRLEDSTLIARRLASIKIVACASPDFLSKHGIPVSPDDLESLPELRYSHRKNQFWSYRGPNGQEGKIKTSSHFCATNGEFLRDAALAHQGFVIEPCFILHNELRCGQLVEILPEYTWSPVAAYAVYPPTRHLSNRVRAFVDYLIQRYDGIPYWEVY